MIFVTVGSQLPFDRLIKGMDEWAAKNTDTEVLAQIGNGEYTPKSMDFAETLSPETFREKSKAAEIIVSHAGVGNILLSLELQKPVILMPRRFELKEHRNDHQMATVKNFDGRPGIHIVYNVEELDETIAEARRKTIDTGFSPYASDELIAAIKTFIGEV